MKLYANKLNNLGQMNEFLETYNLLKLKQEEIKNLNRLITSKEMDSIIKKIPTNPSSGPDDLQVNSTKHLKKN